MKPPLPTHPAANNTMVVLGDHFVLVEQQLERVENALKAADADVLPVQTEVLAKLIQQFQQVYQSTPAPDLPTWQPQLEVVNARLDNLQKQLLARSATVNRALGTLFPAEQANAYARLGKPGGMLGGLPRMSNNTSYKA